MADLEKTIKGMECHKNGFCFACPYNDGVDETTECKRSLIDDAISLLKAAQEQQNRPTYIVTESCYSDYHIEGVFLNEESAKKYAAMCEGEVETFVPLDKSDGHQDDEKLIITYSHSDNKIINIYFSTQADRYDRDTCYCDKLEFPLKVNSRVGQDVLLNGADSELALKVAQDRYAAWKYENEVICVEGIVSTRKNLKALAEGVMQND